MKENEKYLGINQPIPFTILDEILYNYFNNKVLSNEEVKRLIKEYLIGDNRIDKALSHINVLLTKNQEILHKIKKIIGNEGYLKLTNNDRLCIATCFVALTFPVTYDFMNVLGVGFKVQQKINRNYIDQKLTSTYGSNRGIYNAVDALIKMLIDFRLITRKKNGVFEIAPVKNISNPLINELYVYTDIKLSGTKAILLDELVYKPWYMFFSANIMEQSKLNFLNIIEMRGNEKYLSVKKLEV
ncbi:MAG: hypothetical protein V1773_18210 [bacterium]